MSGPANTQFTVGLHAMVMLAHADEHGSDEWLSSDRIAVSAGTNPVYVRRVLGHLRRAGYVRSTPGANGGWQLSRPPAEITLSEVWTAITSNQGLIGVHAANPDCPVGRDVQTTLEAIDRRAWQAVQEAIGVITVADITPEVSARLRERLGTA